MGSCLIRAPVAVKTALATAGAIGGKDSHEFILPSETGEDTVFICDHCGYAANAEKAQSVTPKSTTGTELNIEEVYMNEKQIKISIINK